MSLYDLKKTVSIFPLYAIYHSFFYAKAKQKYMFLEKICIKMTLSGFLYYIVYTCTCMNMSYRTEPTFGHLPRIIHPTSFIETIVQYTVSYYSLFWLSLYQYSFVDVRGITWDIKQLISVTR